MSHDYKVRQAINALQERLQRMPIDAPISKDERADILTEMRRIKNLVLHGTDIERNAAPQQNGLG